MEQTSVDDNLVCLQAAGGVRYKTGIKDIPIWGSTVVFSTTEYALQSQDPDDDQLALQCAARTGRKLPPAEELVRPRQGRCAVHRGRARH